MNKIQFNNLGYNFEIDNSCAHYDKAWGRGGIALQILNLSNRYRPLYLADSIPRYSFIRWLDGTQSQSGCFGV
jgi:hypothetical protein